MSERRRWRLIVGWAMALGLGLPVWGAEDAPDEDKAEEDAAEFVEYVSVQDSSIPTSNTIATKLKVPLERTPASVGTVGEELMYEQDNRVLGDALENISGVNTQNGSGVSEFFTIRGFDAISSALIMFDGAEEPEVSFYDTYNMRGVEVYKGPTGFLYGKNALAGSMNIVRKQPFGGDFVKFSGSAGSFDTYRGMLDYNTSTSGGGVAFRLNGLWAESERYRDDKDSRQLAINPSLTWNFGETGKLNINYERVGNEFAPDNGLPLLNNEIPDVRRKNSYQAQSDFSDQKLDRVQIDFETRLGKMVTLRNKTYYRKLDWATDGTLICMTSLACPFPTMPTQVIRDQARLDDLQQYLGNQLEAVIELATGSFELELLTGLELRRETDEYLFGLAQLDDVDLETLAPIDPAMDAGFAPLGPALGDVTNDIVAPYAIAQMQFGSLVDLVLGARYDYIDVEGDVKSLFGPPTSFERDDSEVSPIFGIVVAPGRTLSVYGNASVAYAPPSTRLETVVDPADRQPERGTQAEVGVKKQFMEGKVRTTFALYQLERDRIPIAGPFGFTQQAGDQRSRGVEIEIAAESAPRLMTFFTYAYNDSELTRFARFEPALGMVVDYSGNTPIMAPKHLANLWVSKTSENGLGVSGGIRFVDEQFVSEDNLFALDYYAVLDAAVFYDIERWRFKLNLQNLTDEEYETRGIAGGSSVLPADPFAAYVTVEFRLQ